MGGACYKFRKIHGKKIDIVFFGRNRAEYFRDYALVGEFGSLKDRLMVVRKEARLLARYQQNQPTHAATNPQHSVTAEIHDTTYI